MADPFQDREDRLEGALAGSQGILARAYMMAVRALRVSLSVPEIRRLLARGGTRDVARAYIAGMREFLLTDQGRIVDVAEATAAEIGRQLGRRRSLDLSSLRLATALSGERDRVAALLVGLQLAAAETAYSEAIRRQEDPAHAVRDSLGLTSAQVLATLRYEDVLVATPPEELDDSTITAGNVERMVRAYRRNALEAGAALLGLDLAQQASAIGDSEALAQAEDDRLIDPVEWEWLTARDERVRPSHKAMSGQRRPDGEAFLSGDGNRLRYPGDPSAPRSDTARCRCVRRARAGVPARSEVA